MENFPDSTPAPVNPPPRPDDAANGGQSDTLTLQVIMGAVLVLLITSSVAMLQQVRGLSYQASEFFNAAQEMSKTVAAFETNSAPQMSRLFNDLTQFADTHPDYAKLLSKYRVIGESQRPAPSSLPQVVAPAATATNPAASRK